MMCHKTLTHAKINPSKTLLAKNYLLPIPLAHAQQVEPRIKWIIALASYYVI